MRKLKEIKGQYGYWTVIKELPRKRDNTRVRRMFLCKCRCGIEKRVAGEHLSNGKSLGCKKCRQQKINFKDISESIFGRLKVLSLGENVNGGYKWNCICNCGQMVSVDGAKLRSGHTQSCGCYNREINRSRKGELAPNWNPELTGEFRERNRKTEDYYNWRRDVYKRDDYCCRKCNTRGGILNAHHIMSFARNPELRTNIDNGVTLCKDCHTDFHKEFGIITNKEDFNKFMQW